MGNNSYLTQVDAFFDHALQAYEKGQKNASIRMDWKNLCEASEDVFFIQVKEAFHLNDIQYFTVLLVFQMECNPVFISQYNEVFKSEIVTLQVSLLFYGSLFEIYRNDMNLYVNEIFLQTFFLTRADHRAYNHNYILILHSWIVSYVSFGTIPVMDGIQTISTKQINKVEFPRVSFLRYCQQGAKEIADSEKTKKLVINYLQQLDFPVIYIQEGVLPSSWDGHILYAFCNFYFRVNLSTFLIEVMQHERFDSFMVYAKKLPLTFLFGNGIKGQNYIPYLTLPYDEQQEKPKPSVPFVKIHSYPHEKPTFIADEQTMQKLQMLQYMDTHRKQIREVLSQTTDQSISALFYGPSGCGKTLAASVLAYHLKKDVWQVNLADVMDKYIGESEKHMAEIFHQAAYQNVILLFDEADILFAKRTEIKNANDRYANANTAFLLQQMEAYQGMLLLTSNFLHNFDDAFLRRLHFIIRFPLPNEYIRLKIWESKLQKQAFDENIEVAELAKLSLSPARITRVYEHALIYQLMAASNVLNLYHIALALQDELLKHGEQMPVWLLEATHKTDREVHNK